VGRSLHVDIRGDLSSRRMSLDHVCCMQAHPLGVAARFSVGVGLLDMFFLSFYGTAPDVFQ